MIINAKNWILNHHPKYGKFEGTYPARSIEIHSCEIIKLEDNFTEAKVEFTPLF